MDATQMIAASRPAYESLPLFNQPPPAQRHSITSMQAADSMGKKNLTELQRRVLEFIRACPEGATDEEIATALQLNPSTERPRRIELCRRGLVVEAGIRKTTSRRNATVWSVS